jgi:hypothetical protein
VIDPTENVKALNEAGTRRLDDLRKMEAKAMHRELKYMRREMRTYAKHAREMREGETKRLDAVRLVDVGNVNRAAEVAADQASVLAQQLVATKEQTQTQVTAVSDQNRALVSALGETFTAALAAAIDPMRVDIRDLRTEQSRTEGGKEQSTESRGVGQWATVAVIAGFGLLVTAFLALLSMVAIGLTVYSLMHK